MNPPDRGEAAREQDRHARLLADVSRAADVIAPMWPLTTFIAVNPLGGMQHLSFDDATAAARRWLGARTHPSFADDRGSHARGEITDADLRRAVVEVVPRLDVGATVEVAGRLVDAVELVRLDVVEGPENPPEATVEVGDLDQDTTRAVAHLVGTWCAAFVDEAGVPCAMPDRDQGFYRAWQRLAPHDRRVRRLAGRQGARWLAHLPDRPVAALAAALSTLGVSEADHVDVLRGYLARLPGWSSHARWRDEWVPPGDHGPALHLVDLLAVHAATAAAIVHGRPGDRVVRASGTSRPDLLDERVDAVLSALGSGPHDPGVVSVVTDVLRSVSPATRAAIWLAAREGNLRDRLLARMSRPEPGPPARAADVQAVFCIDARSEGLRRHLEAVGDHETLGFAGFFGVPMRWRPFGSAASQPRCPVLVTPHHEIAERPVTGDDASRRLATQQVARSSHESFHAAKGNLASPFVLAEAAGWVLGPLAAARTLAPSFVGRAGRWSRALFDRGTTFPVVDAAVDAGQDATSGMTLDERTLFAHAIVSIMGLSRFARLVVLCGHGSRNVNNPHASAYDCGACGGSPGGASARVAAAILNDPAVRARLDERGTTVPDDTWFVAAEHDTVSDTVTILDRHAVPDGHRELLARFEQDVAVAGDHLARERARRLPGNPSAVRVRGLDWAQVRPEWGLVGSAAFVVGPRSITRDLDLACRVFLHSYDAELDPDGVGLETILTAPLVVAQWISAQYYFSTVDPDVFGAGDKMLHNPVGGIGVVLGDGGDLQVGLPAQAVAVGDRRVHEPVRLLAVVQAPLERTEQIIQRNQVLRDLFGGGWIALAGRPDGTQPWSIRDRSGSWSTWQPADASVDHVAASLENS